jgi:hypothetical protein
MWLAVRKWTISFAGEGAWRLATLAGQLQTEIFTKFLASSYPDRYILGEPQQGGTPDVLGIT